MGLPATIIPIHVNYFSTLFNYRIIKFKKKIFSMQICNYLAGRLRQSSNSHRVYVFSDESNQTSPPSPATTLTTRLPDFPIIVPIAVGAAVLVVVVVVVVVVTVVCCCRRRLDTPRVLS